jgi:oxygen-dependent protoporphyrinogen oxidase
MKHVVIIGGGISGLAAAFHVTAEAESRGMPVEVTLLEKGGACGGKMRTLREGGYICESGPNGFLDNKPHTAELCEELGMGGAFLRSRDAARRRYIFSNRKLHLVPATPVQFFTSNLLTVPGRLRIVGELFARRPPAGDETIHDFATRRIGGEAARKILDPMVSGVFAGATEALSIGSSFPRIKELEDNYGGLIRAFIAIARERRREKKTAADDSKPKAGPGGPGGVLTSFAGGSEELIVKLTAILGNTIRTNAAVESVVFDEQRKSYCVTLENGKSVSADACIVTAPAWDVAKMLRGLDKGLAGVLGKIPWTSCVVAGIGLRRTQVKHPLDAFGFLIPSRERRNILGCLFTSSIFPDRAPDGRVLLRVFMGGYRRMDVVDRPDGKLLDTALGDLSKIIGLRGDPEFVRVFRHERAIPQYTLGHAARLAEIRRRLDAHPGLFLAGNSYDGVALNDCTRTARETARKAAAFLE